MDCKAIIIWAITSNGGSEKKILHLVEFETLEEAIFDAMGALSRFHLRLCTEWRASQEAGNVVNIKHKKR